jgi:Glycosyl transferase family 2
MDPPALSVVVPCYNEQEVLRELHARVSAACADLGEPYQIVLVNDGSRRDLSRHASRARASITAPTSTRGSRSIGLRRSPGPGLRDLLHFEERAEPHSERAARLFGLVRLSLTQTGGLLICGRRRAQCRSRHE